MIWPYICTAWSVGCLCVCEYLGINDHKIGEVPWMSLSGLCIDFMSYNIFIRKYIMVGPAFFCCMICGSNWFMWCIYPYIPRISRWRSGPDAYGQHYPMWSQSNLNKKKAVCVLFLQCISMITIESLFSSFIASDRSSHDITCCKINYVEEFDRCNVFTYIRRNVSKYVSLSLSTTAILIIKDRMYAFIIFKWEFWHRNSIDHLGWFAASFGWHTTLIVTYKLSKPHYRRWLSIYNLVGSKQIAPTIATKYWEIYHSNQIFHWSLCNSIL